MFYVGQEVECIDDGGGHGVWWRDDDKPIVGVKYTIRRLFTNVAGLQLDLNEIRRGKYASAYWGFDVGYGAWRFRPIQKKRTDISMLTALLNTKSIKELV